MDHTPKPGVSRELLSQISLREVQQRGPDTHELGPLPRSWSRSERARAQVVPAPGGRCEKAGLEEAVR